jgi:hypothetical protein
LLVTSILLIAACGPTLGDQPPIEPTHETLNVEASYFPFPSVEALAQASNFIVVATVDEVGKGYFEPAPATEDFQGTQMLRVSLRIEEVLKGDLAPGETIPLRWFGYEVAADGTPGPQWIVLGQGPPRPGERSVWFLIGPDERGDHVLVGFEGRLEVNDSGGLRPVGTVESGARDELSGVDLAGLRAAVGG